MINFKNKPLTPHITIYRTENSSLYSIWHRITGILLLIFLCSNSLNIKLFNWEINIWWNYKIHNLIINYNITTIYIIFLFCLLFHTLNGIYHLIWDINTHHKMHSFTIFLYLLLFFILSIIYLIIN